MKNYLITSNEYEIVSRRLKRLYDKREMLKVKITNITSTIKEVVVNGGISEDKMTNYLSELEEVELEIAEREVEADTLKDDLEYMDSRLSNINEIKEQVFIMFYIQGLEPKHIAPKIPCDISTVYKKLREINMERESVKKHNNIKV